MADEAYRAVFLRVHPTGKMVLSLTTEADGNEGRYAQLVARSSGSGARRQGRPADESRFGAGTGSTRARPTACPTAIAQRDREDPREGAADRGRGARDARRRSAVGGRRVRRPAGARTIADIALYAHGSGALPPGVEGGLDAQAVYAD